MKMLCSEFSQRYFKSSPELYVDWMRTRFYLLNPSSLIESTQNYRLRRSRFRIVSSTDNSRTQKYSYNTLENAFIAVWFKCGSENIWFELMDFGQTATAHIQCCGTIEPIMLPVILFSTMYWLISIYLMWSFHFTFFQSLFLFCLRFRCINIYLK